MRGIRRAAADAEDEQASAAISKDGQLVHGLVDGGGIQLSDDFLGLFEVRLGKIHISVRSSNNVAMMTERTK